MHACSGAALERSEVEIATWPVDSARPVTWARRLLMALYAQLTGLVPLSTVPILERILLSKNFIDE